MKKTIVVSAFPGCGKSYAYNHYGNKFSILDSDSSNFSWIKDAEGNNTEDRNPDFPKNYIEHIKNNIGKVDIIFVSSHDIVRKELEKSKINYFLVYPVNSNEQKNEWLKRFRERGNNEKFIEFISNNWDNFIDDIEQEMFPILVPLSNQNDNGNYITDTLLDNLMFLN